LHVPLHTCARLIVLLAASLPQACKQQYLWLERMCTPAPLGRFFYLSSSLLVYYR
jgi:hypothetical protein